MKKRRRFQTISCGHRAKWRAVATSADGRTRYGVCPLCEAHVCQAVPPAPPRDAAYDDAGALYYPDIEGDGEAQG